MWREIPSFLCIASLLLCYLVGIILWIRVLFFRNKTSKNFPIPPYLKINFVTLFIIGIGFILGPYLCQRCVVPLLNIFEYRIEKTFVLIVLGECMACLWVVYVLHWLKCPDMHFDKKNVVKTLQQGMEGYCKSLPLVFCSTLFGDQFFTWLSRLGLSIPHEPQFILHLLEQYIPSTYLLIPLILSIVFLAPFCEEIIFRGILLSSLCTNFSIQKSLWLSSFLFAVAHQDLSTFFSLFCLGYLLGWYYLKTKNIYVNMGIHSIFNGMNLMLWEVTHNLLSVY